MDERADLEAAIFPAGRVALVEETSPPGAPGRPLRSSGERVWRLLLGLTGRAGRGLVDLVYPPSCLACAAPVGDCNGLCAACWQALPLVERPCCERLGTPFAIEMGPGLLSPAALADPPVFGRARAVARYDGPARVLVHSLKFGDRLELAPAMGRWMARAGRELTAGADALVPVPLHPTRLWRRRANQAALLAAAVSRECGVPVRPDWLVRVKATRPQVGLSRNERALNLQGSFRVADHARLPLAGRRLAIIDDVLTTGSTANAAARVLLRAGASGVDVLTFAQVSRAP
jgi:ComF family protein